MPRDLYNMVVLLQQYTFDVNNEKNEEGDLLIHAAIRGGKFSLVYKDKSKIILWLWSHIYCTCLCRGSLPAYTLCASQPV